MELALAQARAAAERGEVPIGAVIVGPDGTVLASAGNRTEADSDPTAHAEMLAICTAAAPSWARRRLVDCDLHVTLGKPCPGCAPRPISFARTCGDVYYGKRAGSRKGGGIEHGPQIFGQPTCHHRPEVYGGIAEQEAGKLLRAFFKERR